MVGAVAWRGESFLRCSDLAIVAACGGKAFRGLGLLISGLSRLAQKADC